MRRELFLGFPEVDEVRGKYGLSIVNLLSVGSSLEGGHVVRLGTEGSTQTLIELGNEKKLTLPKMSSSHGVVGRYIDEVAHA